MPGAARATRALLYDPRNDPAPLGDQHIIALFDQSDVPAQLVFQFLDAAVIMFLTPIQ